MKKQIFAICAGLFILVPVIGAFGQAGYTGPNSAPNTRPRAEAVTAATASNYRDDTRVTLQGTIVNRLGNEKYTFRDSSGEIVVEIDYEVWNDLSIGENDRVEIYGEIDVERSKSRGTRTEIDVKTITKL